MTAPEDYCREIEAYLCRKNDGHLIRIVGPAFEQVASWAREGIPLRVAFAGVDRYFARYYRKGPRRRPVRIEYCDADVRDAFDDWRRAVGVTPAVDADGERRHRNRTSLAAHIDRSAARLTRLRGSTQPAALLANAIEPIVRQLDAMQASARSARGDARLALLLELETLDHNLLKVAVAALTVDERQRLRSAAEQELATFRGRMLPESFAKAQAASFERLVREVLDLPSLRYHG